MIRIAILALLSFMVSAPILVDDDFTGQICPDGRFYSEGCPDADRELTNAEYCIAANGNDANDGRCAGGTGPWRTLAQAETATAGLGGVEIYLLNTDTHSVTNYDVPDGGSAVLGTWYTIGAYYMDGNTPRVLSRDWDWSDNPVVDCAGAYCFKVNNKTRVVIQDLYMDGGPVLTDPDGATPASVNSWVEIENSASYVRILGNRMISASAQNEYDCIDISSVSYVELAYNDAEVCGTHGDVRFGGAIAQKGDLYGMNHGSSYIWVHHNLIGMSGHSSGAIRADYVVHEFNTYDPTLPNGVEPTDARAAEMNLDNYVFPDGNPGEERNILSQKNRYLNFKAVGAVLQKQNVTGLISRYDYVDGNNVRGPRTDTCCFSYPQDVESRDNSVYNWTFDSGTRGNEVWRIANFNPQSGYAPDIARYADKHHFANFAVRSTLPGGIALTLSFPTDRRNGDDAYQSNVFKGWAFEVPLSAVLVDHAQEGTNNWAGLEISRPSNFLNNTGGLADAVTADQGTDLATVQSGCGTTDIVVDRARWFWAHDIDFNADGIDDVQADRLVIGGVNAPTLTGRNTDTNTLTFASAVTCNAGDGVNHLPIEVNGNVATGIPASITTGIDGG